MFDSMGIGVIVSGTTVLAVVFVGGRRIANKRKEMYNRRRFRREDDRIMLSAVKSAVKPLFSSKN